MAAAEVSTASGNQPAFAHVRPSSSCLLIVILELDLLTYINTQRMPEIIPQGIARGCLLEMLRCVRA